MGDALESPAAFWDAVFMDPARRGPGAEGERFVSRRSADTTIGMLSMVGPFEEELAEARAVLDVGPGEGLMLDRAAADCGLRGLAIDRYAIEVSRVNRVRLAHRDIVPLEPGDTLGGEGACIDLAWSLSCFPHCDFAMQRVLLAQVATLLRPGGVFYVEGVELRPNAREAPGYDDATRTRAGMWWVQPRTPALYYGLPRFDAWAREVGLVPEHLVERSLGRDVPVRSWVMRLVKLPEGSGVPVK